MGEAVGADVGALPRRCWPRARRSPRRTSTTASTSSRRSSGKACAPAAPTDAKSMVGDYSPEAIALLKQEGPKYQYGDGCLADGVLGFVDGAGLRRRPGARSGQGREPPRRRAQAQPAARPVDALEPAAAVVRGRQGRRPADLHLATRRQADAAVRLLGRSVDRHRVSGRVAPDAARPRRRRPRDRARRARPLRRPRPQPVQRVRVRPLVRPGDGVATACSRA